MKALFFVFSTGEKVKVINNADEHWWEGRIVFFFFFFQSSEQNCTRFF